LHGFASSPSQHARRRSKRTRQAKYDATFLIKLPQWHTMPSLTTRRTSPTLSSSVF
jgi:hypothetical protein